MVNLRDSANFTLTLSFEYMLITGGHQENVRWVKEIF